MSQPLPRDLRRHDLSRLDHRRDHVALWAARCHLCAQQITRRKVGGAILFHNLGALRALAGARSTEDKDDCAVGLELLDPLARGSR